MAYCIAKSIEIQRSKALKEIFLEGRSVTQVARRFGRERIKYEKGPSILEPCGGLKLLVLSVFTNSGSIDPVETFYLRFLGYIWMFS